MPLFRLKDLKNEGGFIKAVLFHEALRMTIMILILNSCFNNQYLMITGSKKLTENHMNCG